MAPLCLFAQFWRSSSIRTFINPPSLCNRLGQTWELIIANAIKVRHMPSQADKPTKQIPDDQRARNPC